MKKTRRIAAFIAAMAMAACVAVPFGSAMTASAAAVYVDTTTGDSTSGYMADNANTTHTYTAYPIFAGTVNGTGLTVTGWATNYDSASLLADTTFTGIVISGENTVGTELAKFTSPTAAQVAKIIETIPASSLDTLANVLYAHKGTVASQVLSTNSEDKTTLDAGYYVIDDAYEAKDSSKVTNDATSKFMLKVSSSEDVKIIPKKSYPSVIKKVEENVKTPTGTVSETAFTSSVTGKYNDVADYNIGDAVPFKLYGSMPATLGDYACYYYLFTDTLGTEFNQPETVTVTVGNKTLTFTLTDSATGTGKVYTLPEKDQLAWKYDATDATKVAKVHTTDGNCRVKWDAGEHKLYVAFEDIKAYDGVTKDTIVTVAYTAVLNETAKIGLPGQVNTIDLTYTNNPNFEYKPDTDTPNTPDLPETPDKPGTPPETPNTPPETPEKPDTPGTPDVPTDKTPEDKVIVFTYEIDLTKVDATTKEKLTTAEFNLKKGEAVIKLKDNGNGIYTVDPTATNTTIKSTNGGVFKIIGLDDATYTLVETKQPDGYPSSIVGTATSLELKATTANNQSWAFTPSDALTKLELNDVENDKTNHGVAEAEITNDKATTLPSTGGMGTVLFYTVGGVLVIGAGVVLVTKKRMGKED